MKHNKHKSAYIAAIAAALHATATHAAGPLPFKPLSSPGSLRPTGVGEDQPFLLPNGYTQSVLADQLNTFSPAYQPGAVGGGARWGNWDMLTLNETGPDAGRYMFVPAEIAGQGVMRYDFQTKQMVNLAVNNTVNNGRLDPARWTPWGTVIAGDENTKGSIFEIVDPLASDPTTVSSVRRLDLGRVAFEGISRDDKTGNWYYGDESATGSIFKYVPKPENVGTPNELVGGQIFALKLDSPTTSAAGNKNGTGSWIPLNDAAGNPVNGAVGSATDPRVDSRAAALAAGATTWNRPEDSVITTLSDGNLAFFITPTGTSSTISVELNPDGTASVRDFATQATLDLATGLPVGNAFRDNDNLALGPDGRIYMVEDGEPNGGSIWASVDLNNDGDLLDAGEGIGRFASLLTNGSEPSGLYWDAFRNQWLVDVQHPASGNGMTIAITTTPDGGSSLGFLAIGLVGTAGFRVLSRRKK